MTKCIKNPEQAAKERDLRYNQLIIDGEDAEAVFKYVYKLKKEAEQDVLNALLSSSEEKIQEQKYYYRAVCRLCDMLVHAANVGKRRAADAAKD